MALGILIPLPGHIPPVLLPCLVCPMGFLFPGELSRDRSPHPGLWKKPLNHNISHFQGVCKPSALSSEMALASSSSCRVSDGFQRNNPFFRTNAWKCIWKAMSGSFFSVKSVRLNRSDGKCWCGQECLHPEGSGHWAVSQRN